MMPSMLPRVGKGRKANVFYNTGHGHLGWTLSAITADMVGAVVADAYPARSGRAGDAVLACVRPTPEES
jgi:D-amino-acid dehydrogenase